MHALVDYQSWVQLASGLLVSGLGIFMLTVRPGRPANRAFALFAIPFGATFVLSNAGVLFWDEPVLDPSLLNGVLRALGALLAIAGLAWVASVFPTPLAARERWMLAVPASGGVVTLLVGVPLLPGLVTGAANAVVLSTIILLWGFIAGLPGFFALRAAGSADPAGQRQFALVAASFALYPGFVATAGGSGERVLSILDPRAAPLLVLLLALTLLSCLLWLRAAARIEASRAARNTALLSAGLPGAGLLYVVLDLEWGALGIVRTGMVVFVAYGIVRHQLLGIDVKVRWGISKTTVAAAFIAVFFIASEAAQQFFGERLGSQYVGIVAAGALVFAIAPLSRLADRVAEKAVPVTAPKVDDRETTYRDTLARFLRDGLLSNHEEMTLARLAKHLGIDPVRALELRREAQQGPAPPGAR